ncbi:hypothetical protein CH370_09595 [Leptospira kmetyi]|uniref:hypothetical protein n=1 Tax=Leptospira kmetyi TaxID=408139 RepID=UPI000C29A038|nr:hypothetical protein [Leptospira kmetyi]PJZ41686.1 hypothetical protein CH370_09595 [Leptospira kmetyi]
MKEREPNIKSEIDSIALSEFLEGHPPSQIVNVKDLYYISKDNFGEDHWYLNKPEINLYCSNDKCNGNRFFRNIDSGRVELQKRSEKLVFLNYQCSNCQDSLKVFSAFVMADNGTKGQIFKFGELPFYGPPTPSKLITLIGPDREIFLKGRQCENQSLGIGAFIYYRRVVENQKNRILTKILDVIKKLNVQKEKVTKFEEAIKEIQFSKAIELVKDDFPEILLVNGKNPLKLLHSVLSEGVHNRTDEQCLNLAQSIRIVLAELSERISIALKDEQELLNAISILENKKNA